MEDVYGNIANFFDVSQEITLNTVSKNIMNKFNVKRKIMKKMLKSFTIFILEIVLEISIRILLLVMICQ